MIKQRLFFGALIIAVLIGLIWADNAISPSVGYELRGPGAYHGFVVLAVLCVLVGLATRELATLFRSAGHESLFIWPGLICLTFVLIPYLIFNRKLSPWHGQALTEGDLDVVILTLGFVGCAFFVAARRKTNGAIAAIATSLFMIVYLGLLPQFMMRIRYCARADVSLLIYFIATVKVCDIGAYFTGRALGRHKMIEWLSPKKTWEGLAGGVSASILVALVVPMILVPGPTLDPNHRGIYPAGGFAVLFGLTMALVGQAGDLLESLIKRDAAAKDSAAAIPAFGGILDILDSLLLTAPFAYWMLVT